MELCDCGTSAHAVSSMCTASRRISCSEMWTIWWTMMISSTTRTRSRPSCPAQSVRKRLRASLASTCSRLAETAVFVKLMSCLAIQCSCTSKSCQSRASPKMTKMGSFGTARLPPPSISSRCPKTSTKSATISASSGKSTRRLTTVLKSRRLC